MKDMIDTTDHDFQVVNAVSIVAIFVIIALVEKSISLPFVLIAVIELAVFINLGLPHYFGQSLPLHRPHLHQYHPVGRHGGLRHSDDHPLQIRAPERQ